MKKVIAGIVIGIIIVSMCGCAAEPAHQMQISFSMTGEAVITDRWDCPECWKSYPNEAKAQQCLDNHQCPK